MHTGQCDGMIISLTHVLFLESLTMNILEKGAICKLLGDELIHQQFLAVTARG